MKEGSAMVLDRSKAPALAWMGNVVLPEIVTTEHRGLLMSQFVDPVLEVVDLRFVFARIDVSPNPLVADAAMELLLRGTEFKSAEQLYMAFELYGARISAKATADFNVVRIGVSVHNLFPVLELVEEVLFHPRYSEQDFDQWLGKELADFKVALEDPTFLVQCEFQRRIFGLQHRYGRTATLEAYDTLTLAEIRSYWQSNIVGGMPELLVAGGTESLAHSILQRVALWSFTNKDCSDTCGVFCNSSVGFYRSPVEQGTQVALQLGLRLPSSPMVDEFVLQVAVALLGGVFSSRLMQNLREDKGYTYGVRAGITFFEKGGVLKIRTSVGNEYAQAALDEISLELRKMQTNPATSEELAILSGQLRGEFCQSLDGVLNAVRSVYRFGKPPQTWLRYIEEQLTAINSTTPSEIVRVSERWLNPSNFNICVAGAAAIIAPLQWR